MSRRRVHHFKRCARSEQEWLLTCRFSSQVSAYAYPLRRDCHGGSHSVHFTHSIHIGDLVPDTEKPLITRGFVRADGGILTPSRSESGVAHGRSR